MFSGRWTEATMEAIAADGWAPLLVLEEANVLDEEAPARLDELARERLDEVLLEIEERGPGEICARGGWDWEAVVELVVLAAALLIEDRPGTSIIRLSLSLDFFLLIMLLLSLLFSPLILLDWLWCSAIEDRECSAMLLFSFIK